MLDLDRRINKTGDLWHVFVGGLEPPVEYTYRMDMRPNPAPHRHRFNPDIDLLDPYAREISGDRKWGFLPSGERKVRRSLVFDDTYDWEDDQPLEIPLADSVIYEMHVRGFTRHRSSNVTAPGTFGGVVEQIPYLKSLGITAVELLPVFEFEEADTDRVNPLTGENLLNFWGYHPISFFAVNAAYSSDLSPGGPTREFRDMVKALHRAGLEVILDVVLNHTAEGDARGPTFSFRGIDNAVYYQIDRATGEYRNYSGCGNTVNCNHPVVRDAIAAPCAYWVTEMHVDGFRFDLASILGRGRTGPCCRSHRCSNASPTTPRWPGRNSSPRLGMQPDFTRWAPSPPGAVGPSGTASSATTSAASPRAIPTSCRAGDTTHRQRRPVSIQRARTLPQHQLRHLPRRLHAR